MKEFVPYNYARAEKLAERTRAFYNGKKGKLQIQIRWVGGWKTTQSVKKPNQLILPDDMESYLDSIAIRDYQISRLHDSIDDDMMCSTAPWYGIAEHSAFVGGEVTLERETSYCKPVCKEITDFKKLSYSRDNMWAKLVIDGMEYMREKWGEYIPVRLRGAYGPSDFANAIRGNDIFYDIYDSPEELAELLDFCTDAIHFFADNQRKAATEIAGGVISGFSLWMPGNCIGHIAEDISVMLSPEMYEEVFIPEFKRCIDKYDFTMLHTHTLGHAILPIYASIDKIKAIEIASDPKVDRPAKIFRKYHECLSDKVVNFSVNYDELAELSDLYADSKLVLMYSAKDEEDAKRAMSLVEKYRC